MTKLTLPDRELAYQYHNAASDKEDLPGVVFLGGLASDMTGTKATFLDAQCQKAGYSFLRFDYRGHGESSGSFKEGCIGDWFDDAFKAIDTLTKGPQVIIGSSMGGWISLLLARKAPEKFAGLIGIAAAPDFTETLIVPSLDDEQKKELAEVGYTFDKNAPDDWHMPITKKLIEDGRNNLVMDKKIKLEVPVRLFQGMEDDQVPWKLAPEIAQNVTSENVEVTLVKDGDHSLSRDHDLERLWRVTQRLVEGC